MALAKATPTFIEEKVFSNHTQQADIYKGGRNARTVDNLQLLHPSHDCKHQSGQLFLLPPKKCTLYWWTSPSN